MVIFARTPLCVCGYDWEVCDIGRGPTHSSDSSLHQLLCTNASRVDVVVVQGLFHKLKKKPKKLWNHILFILFILFFLLFHLTKFK